MLRVPPKIVNIAAMAVVWGSGLVTVLILFAIIGYVFIEGYRVVTWDFLTTPPLGGLSGEGGISTAIVTTFYIVGLTIAIVIPPGIGAAIYLAEYAADNWPTRVIRYGVETLAGVPSIVFGLFGFAIFVTILNFNFSILAGSLTLACLLLPTLIRASEEAIRAVPRSHREAALAMGATRWQTIWRVLLPAALPGIVTGIILCVGRSVEETACLYVTLGSYAGMPDSIFSPGRTLSLHLYYLASETRAFEKAMGTGVVLIATIIILNAITNFLSARFRARFAGAT